MLAGRVVLIPLGTDAASVAMRLAGEGATVVLLTPDRDEAAQAEAGRLAAEIQAAGSGRSAVFTGPGSAVAEFLDELFRASPPPKG